jgi:hypothetical protein
VTKSVDVRLAKAVHRAVGLPTPAAIARTILASTTGAHNGLRAATYEARVRGTGVDSDTDDDRVRLTTVERLAAARMDRTSDDRTELGHLRDLSRASQRFVDAIGALDAICLDAAPPDTWEQALHDANLLCEVGYVTAALDIGADVTGWCLQACDSVATVAEVAGWYKPRTATAWERYKRNGGRADEVCEIHAALDPPIFKPKHGIPQLCKTCADLTRLAGQRPPVELVRLLERGGQIEYRNARSRWLTECEDEARGA